MEQYKKILKNRMIILSAGAFVSAAMFVLSIIITIIRSEDGGHYEGFLSGFQTGLSFGGLGIFVFCIFKYALALKDEMKLKNMYICENDERNKLIMEKSGGYILLFCGAVIIIAAIPFGYFSREVFYAMFGCGIFLLFTKLILKIYYSLKY